MSFTLELVDELNALLLFDHDAIGDQGIKVHKNADVRRIDAIKRLNAKGLVTLPDGGYLTGLGKQTAAQARAVLDMLTNGKVAKI